MVKLVWLIIVLVGVAFAQNDRGSARINKEVRHELLMLPYLDVFDNLAYRIDGDNVTLVGQVTRPTLKTDAEKAVRSIEGVGRVDNQIEVLPLSPTDERLRRSLLPGNLRLWLARPIRAAGN
jgi:hyperosmotically inducible protein